MNKPISRRGILGLISAGGAAIAARVIPEIAVAQEPMPITIDPQRSIQSQLLIDLETFPVQQRSADPALRTTLIGKGLSSASTSALLSFLSVSGWQTNAENAIVTETYLRSDYTPEQDKYADSELKAFFRHVIDYNNGVLTQNIVLPLRDSSTSETGLLEIVLTPARIQSAAWVWSDATRTSATVYKPLTVDNSDGNATHVSIAEQAKVSLSPNQITVRQHNGQVITLDRMTSFGGKLGRGERQPVTNSCPGQCPPPPPNCREECAFVCTNVCVWVGVFSNVCHWVANTLVCILIQVGVAYMCYPVCNWACRRICG